MYIQLLIFVLGSLGLLTLNRCFLITWQAKRVQSVKNGITILLNGLRIDLHLISALSAPVWIIAPWLDQNSIAHSMNAIYLSLMWFALVLLEISTPQFILEYDTRPNRLYIDYLKHPKEVWGMLWKGYKSTVLLGVVMVVGLTYIMGSALFTYSFSISDLPWYMAFASSLLSAAILFLLIRGTLQHRPINPSTVAFCGDAMMNTLPLNSLYNVLYAVYCLKNERSAEDAYGTMSTEEMIETVIDCAGITPSHAQPSIPTLHQSTSQALTKAKNIVIIVEESLGAQYCGHLHGAGLTPWIDHLAQEAWCFTQAYATGTRSVRGLEAIVAGFPPSISDAAIRLSGAQSGFFTLAQLLNTQGYTSHFIYGGEAHFDNMKSFFLGNGFTELHDQPTFKDPNFVGTWGVSDEDMFNKLHSLLSNPTSPSPTLHVAFSVSNHSPWEYPKGRINPIGEAASVENTVRYADWALGQFFAQARQSEYWNNTVFLVVADHDARVGGKSLIPVRHFHIPALFLGGSIRPSRDERIISQIDLPVTLLSLAGVSGEHPMIGHDLTDPTKGGRAMMQYGENYGYLKGQTLTVLEPLREPSQWHYLAPETYIAKETNPFLVKECLAHALWPNWAYHHQSHTLSHLITSNRSPTKAPNNNLGHARF